VDPRLTIGWDRKGNQSLRHAVVAVDIETGNSNGIPNGFTMSCGIMICHGPLLIDIVRTARNSALAQTGKSGYMYILDRVTGKPVFV